MIGVKRARASEIAEFSKKYPDFKDQVKIYKTILEAQKPIFEDPKKGTTIDQKYIDELQKRGLKESKPLASYLKSTLYDFHVLHKTFLAVIEGFKELNIEGSEKFLTLLNRTLKLIPEFIEKRLQNDHKFFLSLEDKFSASSTVLEVIADTLIQPSMKMITANVKKEEFLDLWKKIECPVCGRIPFIVVKNEEEVWRFHCTFCEAEYAMYIFKCPNCENEDFKKKGFFFIEGREAFEIAYCKECDCYFKIINKYKLKETLPLGLEDLYTIFLDELAQQKNLKRLDALRPSSNNKTGL